MLVSLINIRSLPTSGPAGERGQEPHLLGHQPNHTDKIDWIEPITVMENTLSSDLVEDQLKTLVHFIEQYRHWAKADDNAAYARLNMVAAESLIESANLVRALCEPLKME
jgi:hypothetical protein